MLDRCMLMHLFLLFSRSRACACECERTFSEHSNEILKQRIECEALSIHGNTVQFMCVPLGYFGIRLPCRSVCFARALARSASCGSVCAFLVSPYSDSFGMNWNAIDQSN